MSPDEDDWFGVSDDDDDDDDEVEEELGVVMDVGDNDVDVNTGRSLSGGRCGMLGCHIDTYGHGGSGTSRNNDGGVNNRITVAGVERRRLTAVYDYSQPCETEST